jgi:hypothetical protein
MENRGIGKPFGPRQTGVYSTTKHSSEAYCYLCAPVGSHFGDIQPV